VNYACCAGAQVFEPLHFIKHMMQLRGRIQDSLSDFRLFFKLGAPFLHHAVADADALIGTIHDLCIML
jgi:hypothetical protein